MYFNNYFCLTIILTFLLFITVKTKTDINEENKKKVRACIKLQQIKFDGNEDKINEFINNKTKIYNLSPNKIILLALAYCYDKISLELAIDILKIKIENINIEKLGIKYIYDFEDYNYNDQENNKKIYNNFIPTFEMVMKEIRDKEDKEYKNRFNIYFIHTSLFKFFLFYLLINSIIIFYIRLKSKDQIDQNNHFDNIDNNKNNNEEEELNANNNENNNDNNYRKLKKKKRLGKIKFN